MLTKEEGVAGAVGDRRELDGGEIGRTAGDGVAGVGIDPLHCTELGIVPLVDQRTEVAGVTAKGHRDGRAIPAISRKSRIAEVSDGSVAGTPHDAQGESADRAVRVRVD